MLLYCNPLNVILLGQLLVFNRMITLTGEFVVRMDLKCFNCDHIKRFTLYLLLSEVMQ